MSKQSSKLTKKSRRVARYVVMGLLLLSGGVWWWYTHRSVPVSTRRTLFEGITYVREVRRQPRSLVIHVVTVELDAPRISFLVTPGDPHKKLPLKARTISQFLKEFNVQLAINGAFFTPWHSNGILDYYPHVGDPVDVFGLAASRVRCLLASRIGLPDALRFRGQSRLFR